MKVVIATVKLANEDRVFRLLRDGCYLDFQNNDCAISRTKTATFSKNLASQILVLIEQKWRRRNIQEQLFLSLIFDVDKLYRRGREIFTSTLNQ